MNGTTHRLVGTAAGVAYAGYKALEQDPVDRLLEMMGGGFGGYQGATLPDVLEPATSPCHRRLAHSATVATALVVGSSQVTDPTVAEMRRQAQELRKRAADPAAQPFDVFMLALGATLCHVGAGFTHGFVAGYASHLALDACTPASLPLLFGPARA